MNCRKPAVLSIDQGTTNTKAVLVTTTGQVSGVGSAPVGVTTPRPGWVEQDAERIWSSVMTATERAVRHSPDLAISAVALSTQRESVLAWHARTGKPLGPVIGWQDRRTSGWCSEHVGADGRQEVRRRTGLRVDAMFSAPKLRWLLDHLPEGVAVRDVRAGTVDAWLVWRLSGGRQHLCEAGNASRTLLYDVFELSWSDELLETFGIPRSVLPEALPSDEGFGLCRAEGAVPAGIPIAAVLADSHAALFGHGCTEPGMAKATYGTGSSVMTPVADLPAGPSPVPATLAWLLGSRPTYALEGNILSSGATLSWAADLLAGGQVGQLVELAASVPDAAGVTLVPAFAGLGAPHWDRGAEAMISGMTAGTTAAHIARAAVESVGHQVADVIDVIESTTEPLRSLRADGGATAANLLMQDQADLLDRTVEVTDVAEVSALGAAKLAWSAAGEADVWVPPAISRRYTPQPTRPSRERRRQVWAGEVARACYSPGTEPHPSAAP